MTQSLPQQVKPLLAQSSTDSLRVWLLAILASGMLHLIGVGIWIYYQRVVIVMQPTPNEAVARDRAFPIELIAIEAQTPVSAQKNTPETTSVTPSPIHQETSIPAQISKNHQISAKSPSPPSQSPKKAISPLSRTNSTPTPNPSPTPQPTPNPSPTPKPQASPNPSPTPQPTPNPSPTPKPQASPNPSPTPQPTPNPTSQPSPTTQNYFRVQVGEMRRGWTGDVISQAAQIKQKEKQLERINYLTPLGINLDGVVRLEAVIIIEINGKATVEPQLTEVLQGNLSQAQAEKLAQAILAQWQFEPAYMEGEPVVQDYVIQLTLSPLNNG